MRARAKHAGLQPASAGTQDLPAVRDPFPHRRGAFALLEAAAGGPFVSVAGQAWKCFSIASREGSVSRSLHNGQSSGSGGPVMTGFRARALMQLADPVERIHTG